MMQIERQSRGWVLTAEQLLPASLEQTFEFFSQAENLEELTPPRLHFEITSPRPVDMHQGTIIDYRLKLHGIPLRWQSEISVWDPPHCFVDTQLRGPYRKWIHTHSFEETPEGTLARDHVEYDVLGGRIVHALAVKPDLLAIFAFREQKLKEVFALHSSNSRSMRSAP